MTAPILIVAGTRPEAVKLAPLVMALRRSALADRTLLCVSGQHVHLTMETLGEFGVGADMVLSPPPPGADLLATQSSLTAQIAAAVDRTAPALVISLGDTVTAFAAALTAAHAGVPVAHVEAGLRTGDLSAPFPEEMYRRMIAVVAAHHFAPTPRAAENLLAEGIAPERIHVTGNTGVDALHHVLRARGLVVPSPRRPEGRVLVSLHRRETLGAPLRAIFEELRGLAVDHPEVRFTCPIHPNPTLVDIATRAVGESPLPNLDLCAPLKYRDFVTLLVGSDFLMTDSGGLQEEAPILGVPVLVLRQRTDRGEAVDAGNAQVVGLEPAGIRAAAEELLAGGESWRERTRICSPFGDGRAAVRICEHLCRILGVDDGRAPRRA